MSQLGGNLKEQPFCHSSSEGSWNRSIRGDVCGVAAPPGGQVFSPAIGADLMRCVIQVTELEANPPISEPKLAAGAAMVDGLRDEFRSKVIYVRHIKRHGALSILGFFRALNSRVGLTVSSKILGCPALR